MQEPESSVTGVSPSLSTMFAMWAASVSYADLPPEVATAARRLLLDTLGVALASSAEEFGSRFDSVPFVTASRGGASAIGRVEPVSPENAALVNGVLAHGIDFDETYQPGFVHVGAIVVPAALAVGESIGATDEEVLTAIVVGYELASRLGEAAPAGFHKYGWHATPLCGIFAATIAAARLRGLHVSEQVAAIGIAGSFASGIQEFLKDGTDTKRLHTGWAASAGINAAALAAAGFGGPARIFEGDFGLYATHLREGDFRDLSKITEELGVRWNITRSSIKPFPCCLQMHAHVEAARTIALDGIDPARITHVRAYIHEMGRHILAEPLDFKRRPTTPYGAQFSLPFGVAVGLTSVDREIDILAFASGELEDPAKIRLAAMVEILQDDAATTPRYRGGAVEVELDDGTVIAQRVPHNPGSPERPMSDAAIEDKFVSNARKVGVSESEARDAVAAIMRGGGLVSLPARLNALLNDARR